MMMAEELNVDAFGMPHLGVAFPADEKDAYIGWLKSEFAAANAIIDSMCQHVQTIGSPGDYDAVFSCLNRRRHAWTPTLYMQQFFSVAEIVNSLEQVTQKKHPTCSSSSHANVMFDAQGTSCGAATQQQSSVHMGTSENCTNVSQCQERTTGDSCETVADVSENALISSANAKKEGKEELEGLHLLEDASAKVAESNTSSCDNITSSEVDITSHTVHSTTDVTDGNKEVERVPPMYSEGLNVNELLNMEVPIALKEEEARQAAIRRSTQFQCCELMNGQMINDGESVELCESVFSSKEVDEFVEVISQFQAAGRQGALGGAFNSCDKADNKPDIIRFGPKYNDGAKMNDNLCMPKFLQAMIRWLTSCGILSAKRRPDSCFISIFDEGDFELPNADQGAWERPLCIISLLGDCSMVFGHFITMDQEGSCKGPFQVALPAGSVLLLQENFAGLLQKAVPSSPCRRIVIALGKAVSTNSTVAAGGYVNVEGKARNKQSAKQNGYHPYTTNVGSLKQTRLVGGSPMNPLPHMIPPHPHPQHHHINGSPLFPFPNPVGLVSPYQLHAAMLQGWSHASPSKLQSSASSGTGVFFPSTELSPWQSGFLVSLAAGLEVRRSGHKKAEKHFKVRGSVEVPKKKLGRLVSPSSLPDRRMGCEGVVTASTCPSK